MDLTGTAVGTFLVSQAALPLLRRADDGWIINITSVAGTRYTTGTTLVADGGLGLVI